MQKSNNQKIAAWLLLGSGTVVSGITGAASPKSGDSSSVNAGGLTGVGLMAASIPFFISSAKHKRSAKGWTVSLKSEQAPVSRGASISKNNHPAVALKIHL